MRWCDRLLAAILIALATALGGCQPLPQPFAEDGGAANPLVQVPETHGLFVGSLDGIPGEYSDRLRRRLAEALQEEGVLASVRSGNGRSYWLSGAVRWTASGGRLDWRLQAPDGTVVGRFEGVDPEASASRVFAREVAEALRRSLPDEQVSPAGAAAETEGPAMALAGVEGAPGDGGEALTRALRAALAMRGFRVVTEQDTSLSVRGEVEVTPVRPGVDRVDLLWSVLGQEGEVLGTVEQSNEVPAGSLDGRWGSVAEAAAQGAADGVVGVLDGLRAQPAGGG